jgi:hypothetical protein
MPKAGWRKNPETGKYEAPASELSAARNDPDDAPIDGDFQKDQVIGKDPSKTYALVHADDLPRMRGRGYVQTPRTPDGPRPVYDAGSESDPNYMVDNLVLMEIPRARAERIQQEAERRGAARWKSQQQTFNRGVSNRDVTVRTERNEHSVTTQ